MDKRIKLFIACLKKQNFAFRKEKQNLIIKLVIP